MLSVRKGRRGQKKEIKGRHNVKVKKRTAIKTIWGVLEWRSVKDKMRLLNELARKDD
jgi:hypothetical protein